MADKVRVLLCQATTLPGGDTAIHGMIMRGLNRSTVDVHVACNYGGRNNANPVYQSVAAIPEIKLLPSFFGTDSNYRSFSSALTTTFVDGPRIGMGLASAVRYIRRNRIQVVHFIERSRDAGIGLLLARASGAKAVLHVHSKVNDWYTPLVKTAIKFADARIAVSKFVMDSIIAQDYPSHNTFYVHNGLDLALWSEQVDGTSIRREFGVAPDRPLLVMVARMSYWKGPTELLKALVKVREKIPHFFALFVGEEDLSAPPGESRSLEDLRSMAASLGLGEQVAFTGRRKDVRQIMAAADIFVMPSMEEPFGMVYTEAQVMCKPVVGTRSGGTPEVVEDGVNGLLSDPHDTGRLAANIVTLIERPDLRRRMGMSGRRRVEEYLNITRMGHDIEQIYRQILAPSPTRRSVRGMIS